MLLDLEISIGISLLYRRNHRAVIGCEVSHSTIREIVDRVFVVLENVHLTTTGFGHFHENGKLDESHILHSTT